MYLYHGWSYFNLKNFVQNFVKNSHSLILYNQMKNIHDKKAEINAAKLQQENLF